MILGEFKKWLALCGYPQRFGSPLVLAQSAVSSSVTGTTAETTLATINIPVGTMGVNGQARVTMIWSLTNNANVKMLKGYLGGQNFFNASVPSVSGVSAIRWITNRNSASSQITAASGSYGASTSGGINIALTVNTAIAQTLTLTGTLATTTDTITLESYTVEILNP